MPGMRKSVTSRSGGSSTAFSNASAASDAVATWAKVERDCFSIPSTMGLSSTRSTFTLLDMAWLRLPARAGIVTAFTAGLAFQHDLADFDALVESLTHVVHGQGSDAGRYQRLHFHAGGSRGGNF